jgi:hypothetical protein
MCEPGVLLMAASQKEFLKRFGMGKRQRVERLR